MIPLNSFRIAFAIVLIEEFWHWVRKDSSNFPFNPSRPAAMQKISAMTSLKGHFEALSLLQRLAAEVNAIPSLYTLACCTDAHRSSRGSLTGLNCVQVTPIMKHHGWIVQHFMEFLPDDKGLLGINVNRGQEIKIRRTCRRRSVSPFVLSC